MQLNLDEVSVINNEQAHRFEATVNGRRALITYRRYPGKIVFDHTEVPEPLEGKGLAAKLTRVALDFARTNQLRVVPLCTYVTAYIRKHSDVHDLLSPDDLQQLLSHSTSSSQSAAGK